MILASSQVANATTDTTIYTVPGTTTAVKIVTFSLTNRSGNAVTVTVSVVPLGGALDGTHVVMSAFPLAAGDSTKVTEVEGALLDAGAFISVNVSAAASINYLLTGTVAST